VILLTNILTMPFPQLLLLLLLLGLCFLPNSLPYCNVGQVTLGSPRRSLWELPHCGRFLQARCLDVTEPILSKHRVHMY